MARRPTGVGAIHFTLRGHEKVLGTLRRMEAQFKDKVAAGLLTRAEQIMTESKQDYVPVDLGTLKTSGSVGQVTRTGRDLSVELSYGGPSVDYALEQHENPSFHHTVGSWKYLELPLNAAVPSLEKDLIAIMRGLR